MNISAHHLRAASRLTLALAVAALATACGSGEPRTDAERHLWMKRITCGVALAAMAWVVPASAKVRSARRGAVVKGEEGKGVAAGPRGVAVKGEEGYAAAGRHGAVAKGDEGYAAVGRRGVVVGNQYESYEGWKIAAGVGVGIAVGTMLARPPKAAVTVTAGGATYWYADGAYYTRVMSSGTMVYQVVGPPVGRSSRRFRAAARPCASAGSPTPSVVRPTINASAAAIRLWF